MPQSQLDRPRCVIVVVPGRPRRQSRQPPLAGPRPHLCTLKPPPGPVSSGRQSLSPFEHEHVHVVCFNASICCHVVLGSAYLRAPTLLLEPPRRAGFKFKLQSGHFRPARAVKSRGPDPGAAAEPQAWSLRGCIESLVARGKLENYPRRPGPGGPLVHILSRTCNSFLP